MSTVVSPDEANRNELRARRRHHSSRSTTELVREMIRRTRLTLDRIGRQGMVRPQLIGETIGADARQ